MIINNVKQTLLQFKRVHKNQIAPHYSVLSEDTQNRIKRKSLQTMDVKAIKKLAKDVISSIDQFQKNRDKPHQGLIKFKKELLSQITQ